MAPVNYVFTKGEVWGAYDWQQALNGFVQRNAGDSATLVNIAATGTHTVGISSGVVNTGGMVTSYSLGNGIEQTIYCGDLEGLNINIATNDGTHTTSEYGVFTITPIGGGVAGGFISIANGYELYADTIFANSISTGLLSGSVTATGSTTALHIGRIYPQNLLQRHPQ
jgi:hypothetical protein